MLADYPCPFAQGTVAPRFSSRKPVMPSTSNYLKQFIQSIRFYTELFDDAPSDIDFGQIEGAIRRYQSGELTSEYARIRQFAAEFGADYVAGYPGEVARACHAVSQGFFETWGRLPFGEAFPLTVTVGNVYYKGNNIYEATKESIAGLIQAGFQEDATVDVHVWLTLDDMTVIDPTIIATLKAKDAISPDVSPILLWTENDPGDFHFEPILTDNQFFSRIDSGIFVTGR